MSLIVERRQNFFIVGVSLIVLVAGYWEGDTLVAFLSDFSISRDNAVLLFQALLGSQVTLFTIVFSAVFVVFQLVSNRYPLNFTNSIFQSYITKFILLSLSMSIILDISALLFIHTLSAEEAKWIVIGSSGMGLFVILFSYPFIRITLSRIDPLYLLRQVGESFTAEGFEKRANQSTSDPDTHHPLREIYLFIRNEVERGKLANAIRGIEILYSVSHSMWSKVLEDSTDPNSKYQRHGMMKRMLTLDEEYTFSHRGAEFFQRIVLFEPIFVDFPMNIISRSSKRDSAEIVDTVVSQVEEFGKDSIYSKDTGIIELSTRCLHVVLLRTINKTTAENSMRWEMIETVVTSTNRLYWHSFENISVETGTVTIAGESNEIPVPPIKELGFKDIEEIEAEYIKNSFGNEEDIEISLTLSPGADIHQQFSMKYKDSIVELFDSLPREELAGNIEVGRLFAVQRSSYIEYLEKNKDQYSEVDLELSKSTSPDGRVISLQTDEVLTKQDILSDKFNEFGDKNEFEEHYRQITLSWPLQSFRRDLLWATEGFFSNTGFPDQISACGYVVGNWLRIATYAANNSPSSHNKELVRAILVLLSQLQHEINDRLSEVGVDLGNPDREFRVSETIRNLPEEDRKKANKLMKQHIGVLESCGYISEYGSPEILEEILKESENGKGEYIFKDFASQYPTTTLWKPLSDREDGEEIFESMELLVVFANSGEDLYESKNTMEKSIIGSLNATTEDFGKYNW